MTVTDNDLQRVIKSIGDLADTCEALRKRIVALEEKLATTRGTRLPKDWELPAEYLEWAREQDKNGIQRFNSLFEVTDQGRAFKDYWLAQSGSKGVKLDWFATWRNWIRKSEKSYAKNPRPDNSAVAKVDRANEAARVREHRQFDNFNG